MILYGPVSSASPNGGGPFWNWLVIIVAAWVLLTGWRKYLTRGPLTKAPVPSVVWITALCAIMIGFGIWGLIH